MSFLKTSDIGNSIVQGPMTYSFTKPLEMMDKISPEDMRDISAISALIGAGAAGGVAAGGGAAGGSSLPAGSGGAWGGAESTAGVNALPSTGTTLSKGLSGAGSQLGTLSMLNSLFSPTPVSLKGFGSSPIQSSKQRRR